MSPADRLADEAQDAVEELRTIADLVRWCASRFDEHDLHFGHGTASAVDEALALVLHALHLAPGLADELFAARATRAERARVAALALERIRTRKPLAYLTGTAWFAGLRFRVDERVLVPRSPLAEWIERAFEPFVDPDSVRRVLDVGTGSGCIAIACAYAFPQAHVDAVDVSADALAVARANVADHGLEGRVRLVEGDLYAGCDGPYDLIVSNPPYVPEASFRALPPEYGHEPALGLRSGDEGLDHVRALIAGAAARLGADGVLVVEVGEAADALERAYPEVAFTWLEFERGGDGVFLLARDQIPTAPAGT